MSPQIILLQVTEVLRFYIFLKVKETPITVWKGQTYLHQNHSLQCVVDSSHMTSLPDIYSSDGPPVYACLLSYPTEKPFQVFLAEYVFDCAAYIFYAVQVSPL